MLVSRLMPSQQREPERLHFFNVSFD